jgi:hypothetical protein
MHKAIKYGILVAAVSLAATWYFDAKYGWLGDQELRIEFDTCSPGTVLDGWRARINPKGFWISQNVILESGLETNWRQDGIRDCGEINDRPEKLACISYFQNRFDSIQKCHRTVLQMCRAYGGHC